MAQQTTAPQPPAQQTSKPVTEALKPSLLFGPVSLAGVNTHTIYPARRDGSRTVKAITANLPIRVVGGHDLTVTLSCYLNETNDNGTMSYVPSVAWPRANEADELLKAAAVDRVELAIKAWPGRDTAFTRAYKALKFGTGKAKGKGKGEGLTFAPPADDADDDSTAT